MSKFRGPTTSELVERSPHSRSPVTNGTRYFLDREVSEKTPWVMRWRDIFELHVTDLGGSGASSEAERSVLRRAATLSIELERMECEFAKEGGAPDADSIDLYIRASGALKRLLDAVGFRRRPRDVTPTLEEYIEAQQRDDEEAQAS